MLVTPRHKFVDENLAIILGLSSEGIDKIIENGIIETSNAHVRYYVKGFGCGGGIADDLEQVKKEYQSFINDPNIKMCVTYFRVIKSEQPESGGWRWHKWGDYIGTKNPQHEYIYDEDDSIQEVICFHVYEIEEQ